jgi:hypothetical protein
MMNKRENISVLFAVLFAATITILPAVQEILIDIFIVKAQSTRKSPK